MYISNKMPLLCWSQSMGYVALPSSSGSPANWSYGKIATKLQNHGQLSCSEAFHFKMFMPSLGWFFFGLLCPSNPSHFHQVSLRQRDIFIKLPRLLSSWRHVILCLLWSTCTLLVFGSESGLFNQHLLALMWGDVPVSRYITVAITLSLKPI